ncbi:hypothetical protein ACQPXH_03480 [Nocardia sp. CA-135953]|uniref:hypothetical protein n=1 Tax=Nocardia sp. CA-135953 TaxID=3239978 RepID=UPI003D97C527
MADPVKQHMLDRLLRIAADRAAAPSGIRFTERQLYYEVCRLLTPTHRAPRRFACTVPAPLSYHTFRAALDRLEMPGLLTLAPPRTNRAGLHTPEPDLFDYGLPRLLVCESDAIAQMLRANGLPMESACPVLSASELPLDPGIAEMLSRVDGTIYLLHDASPHGLTFPTRLADLTEIPDSVRVVPLGLRPRQAGALHLTHLRGPVPRAQVALLDPWECAWLRRGRFVEVEAVRPAALLRTVHRLVREVRPTRIGLPELRRARTTGFLTWPAA